MEHRVHAHFRKGEDKGMEQREGNVIADRIRELVADESGVGVVEIILILVVLISLVILFKGQLTSLVTGILQKITSQSNSV